MIIKLEINGLFDFLFLYSYTHTHVPLMKVITFDFLFLRFLGSRNSEGNEQCPHNHIHLNLLRAVK